MFLVLIILLAIAGHLGWAIGLTIGAMVLKAVTR